MYRHKVLCINYMTYDMRREQDSINARTHSDVMVLSADSPEDDTHPFWYAHVIGVFHMDLVYYGPGSTTPEVRKLEFLWVRWFELDGSTLGGMEERQLHRVSFVHGDDDDAFGFLNPKDVIRGAHLIPAYDHGRTTDLLEDSIARNDKHTQWDWRHYYFNR